MEKVTTGISAGPFTPAELDVRHRNLWLACRRFGVRQGGKIRSCDDFSEFLVNSAVTSPEKLKLGGTDEIIGMARTILDAVQDNRSVTVPDGNGALMTGWLHDDWSE